MDALTLKTVKNSKIMIDLYGGRDPREVPAYGIPEAAHYLHIPVATLRTWVLGRYYPTLQGRKFSEPVMDLADADHYLLSFVNLVEAHVLGAIRRQHQVPFSKIRRALSYLKQHFPSPHPLADRHFETDGLDLFLKHVGQLINISDEGQLNLHHVLKTYLQRIERDESGFAVRLYLFPPRPLSLGGCDTLENAPKIVVVDPRIAFGRPVLVGTGISTKVISQRFEAGESVELLAKDYNQRPLEIEEAIRCELYRTAA